MLERGDTELGRSEGLERSVNRAHRRAGSSDDDSFVTDGGRLERETETQQGSLEWMVDIP